jgi:uncharacterized damage-inducible protein DinB
MHLSSLLRGAHAYLSIDAVIDGLEDERAHHRVLGASHSIAEIVAHMDFWQTWFLDRCDGRDAPVVASAATGWPTVTGGEWDQIRRRFEDGFTRALTLADDERRIAQPVAPPIEFGPLASYTIADALTHIAIHNAHHAGQLVLLRQQLGVWPPPAGGWTW